MDTIKIEVAYARPDCQRIVALCVPVGTTVAEAIAASEIQNFFPEIDLTHQQVGIFSRQAKLTDVLKENDRVEIYRPLRMDPKEARRMRAASFRQRK